MDGVNDLHRVELNDWKALLIMMYTDDGDKPGYELSLETAGPIACCTREYGYTMVIDFDEDCFRFVDYNLFIKTPEMSTLLDFTSRSCFNSAGEPSLMKKNDAYSYDRYGDEMVVRLGDYGIDIIHQDGLYLVPLQTMVDILLTPGGGYCAFFNGQY